MWTETGVWYDAEVLSLDVDTRQAQLWYPSDDAEDEAVRAARDGEEIERRDRAWREAEATRARMPKVPSSRAVKGRAVEKQVLLAAE